LPEKHFFAYSLYMIRRIIISLLAAPALATAPAHALAKESLQLSPSSPWQINYSEDSCRLLRSFGTGEQQIILSLDRFEPDDAFNMVVSGKLAKARNIRNSVQIQFGPDEAEQIVDFKRGEQWLNSTKGKIGDKWPAIIVTSALRIAPVTEAEKARSDAANKKGDGYITLASIEPEREKAVHYIRLGDSLVTPLTLLTGSMAAPFEALRKCTDELIGHWGVDVAALSTQSRKVRPIGNTNNWLDGSDYPVGMIMKRQEAIVHFRLIAGADGKPISCHIQLSTRPAEFDAAVCKGLMQRASFEPALDADGKPIASYYIQTVHFQMRR
jgi:hypothetical protein